MQEEDIELIRKGLLQLFTDGQEATNVDVPHEVGLSPEIAKKYGVQTSTLNVRYLAEFLASIDDARESEWLNVEDAIDIARITSGLGSVEDLAKLEEVLESLTDLVWTAEVTWFADDLAYHSQMYNYSGVVSTGEMMIALLIAEVSPEMVGSDLTRSNGDVLAVAKSRDLPIWLCHWIHDNAWELDELQRMYNDALDEDYLEQDAPRRADEYARKKSKE